MKEKLNRDFIINLSNKKGEPSWMTEFRLNSYEALLKIEKTTLVPKLDFSLDDIL